MLGSVIRRQASATLLALVLACSASFTLAPPSHAQEALPPDPDAALVAAYDSANEQLAQLIRQRESLEWSIGDATAVERASLDRLGAAESTIARLVADVRDNAQRRESAALRLAEIESQAPALEALTLVIERQMAGHERWLLDGEPPRLIGSRAYRASVDARASLDNDRAALANAATEVRDQEQVDMRDLGRLNTEIAFWERQADAFSRQVGTQRARALGANARLGDVQRTGLALSDAIKQQLANLRLAGYPVGVGFASEGKAPVAEPVQWPSQPVRSYVIPFGASAAALRAAEPLPVDAASAQSLALPVQTWTMPVRGPITTPYGDATPYQPAHWAIDIGSRLYEPVIAAADGVAEFVGLAAGDNRLASYGMVVVIRHGERLTSLYSHLDDRAYGALVQPGDVVSQGQVIGYVGLTGNTTGPHVHFEVRLDARPINPGVLMKPGSP